MLLNNKSICPNCFEMGYQDGVCPKCGYQSKYDVKSDMALPHQVILNGRYLIGKVLGEGGFGITYKACDTIGGGICAIKEYVPSGLSYRTEDKITMGVITEEAEHAYQAGLKRFIEEAQILSKLGQLPTVVHITDCFKENQTAYFAMEFLDGATLRQIVRASKSRLPVSEITDIILKVATAMDVIHKKTNILHRDISPENIYITKDKQVKLIDFGSAKQNAADKERDYSVVLKLKFSPPEQFSSKMKQGTYTDVYALASTYYYSLTGISLPTAVDRLSGKAYVPLKQLNIPVSDKLSDAVDKALELKSADRTQTMQEFIDGIAEQKKTLPVMPSKILAKKKMPYVEIISEGKPGKIWIIPPNVEMNIGRSKSDNHIVLSGHPEISKVHCILLYEETKNVFYIQDISTNGTYINGIRLVKNKTYVVDLESKIVFASNACIVIKVGVRNESN